MNALYIITDNSTINIKIAILDQYTNIYCVNSNDSDHCHEDRPLLGDINHYFDSVANLTENTFDWNYYSTKYSRVERTKTGAWKHWKAQGLHNNLNPINQIAINSNQLTDQLAIINILYDSIKSQYNQITIIYDKYQIGTLLDQLKGEQTGQLTVISYHNNNIGYIIKRELYDDLLCELSYLHKPFDSQICNDHQRIEISVNNDSSNITEYQLTSKVPDSLHLIKDWREKYIADRMKSKDLINESTNGLVQHLSTEYSYSTLKSKYNKYIDVDIDHYQYLLSHIDDMLFHDKIKVVTHSHQNGKNILYFDSDFYLSVYPTYKKTFKCHSDPYNHYMIHGICQQLLPNPLIYDLKLSAQKYLTDQLLNATVSQLSLIKMIKEPLIYILTRTCNRKELFDQCVNSILALKHPNIRHIVSYDNIETYEYVNKYQHIYHKLSLIEEKKNKVHPNQYIDYLYDYIKTQDTGWVIVLDDDDKFMTDKAIHVIKRYLRNVDNVVIWMLYRPDKFIYPKDHSKPVMGEIGSCCYAYHTSHIQKGYWRPNGEGDFTFFNQLFKTTTNHIYIDAPLTGVNYNNSQISGWTAM